MILLDMEMPESCMECPLRNRMECAVRNKQIGSAGRAECCPLTTAQDWILCSKELPPEDRDVLVTYEINGKRYVKEACLIGGEWTSAYDEYRISSIVEEEIAWMPKPKPYAGEKKERRTKNVRMDPGIKRC